MYKLKEEENLRLEKVLEKFPKVKEIAKKFNEGGVKWAIAAGTAVFIYCGGDDSLLDDVDIWIASESKQKVVEILGQSWQPQSSERHKAVNIHLGEFDIFADCQRFGNGQVFIDYRWTNSVEEYIRLIKVGGIEYRIISPEDVAILKMANPREGDKMDIIQLEKLVLDKSYLQKRKIECNFVAHVSHNF